MNDNLVNSEYLYIDMFINLSFFAFFFDPQTPNLTPTLSKMEREEEGLKSETMKIFKF